MHIPLFGVPRAVLPAPLRAGSSRLSPFALAMAVFACVLLAPLAVAVQPEPSSPLTLSAALELAERRSQALPAQDHAAAAARDLALAAGRLPDPTLRLSADNVPVDGPMRFSLSEDFMTMRSIGITQTLIGRDKRQARSARFEREADAAYGSRVFALASLRQATAVAWFERQLAQQRVDLLVRQKAEVQLQVDAAEAAYRAGRGAQADVFLARSAVARIEDAAALARAGVDVAMARLERWVGADAARPVDATDLRHLRLDPQRLAQSVEAYPEIALLAAREETARAEAEIARQERSADWSVSLMYSQRGSAYSDMVSVGVSIPLQWDRGNRQDRVLSARLSQAEQLRAEREEAAREASARVRVDIANWRANLERLAQYDTALVPLAQERTDAALAAYRGGKATLAAVLEARAAQVRTQLERLDIEFATARLWAGLAYLLPDEAAYGAMTSDVPLQEVAR